MQSMLNKEIKWLLTCPECGYKEYFGTDLDHAMEVCTLHVRQTSHKIDIKVVEE